VDSPGTWQLSWAVTSNGRLVVVVVLVRVVMVVMEMVMLMVIIMMIIELHAFDLPSLVLFFPFILR
jgi:hypothetical protein